MSAPTCATMASRFVLPAPPPGLSRLPSSSVWLEFIELAKHTSSVSMAQGFPDWSPPEFLLDAARKMCEVQEKSARKPQASKLSSDANIDITTAHDVMDSVHNALGTGSRGLFGENMMDEKRSLQHQYSRPGGSPSLVHAIARKYSERLKPGVVWENSEQHIDDKQQVKLLLDPMSQILVTVGASQGLSLAISAMAGPGDEVILIEPAFDIYTGAVLQVGATPRYVALKCRQANGNAETSADFVLDLDSLSSVMNSKTRLLVLNTPHNPTGKVFSRAELQGIAKVLDEFPHVAVISDEVYEHMTYNADLPHVPFASLSPSTFERTISIYSAGKTFSATGWKVGWAIGPSTLIDRMLALHQYNVFSVASVLQEAVASALDAAVLPYGGFESYYHWLAAEYKAKRDYFVDALQSTGELTPVIPDGAFFVMARHCRTETESNDSLLPRGMPENVLKFMQHHKVPYDKRTSNRKDYNYCRRLALEKKVIAIPPSAFFCPEHATADLAANFARFSFCKRMPILTEARKRLSGRCD